MLVSSRNLAGAAAQQLLGCLVVPSVQQTGALLAQWQAHCSAASGASIQPSTTHMQARCYSAAHTSTSSPTYTPSPGPKAEGRRTHRSPDAWRSRISPGTGRYGVLLRERDPEAFERMRLLLGFYDLPENAHMQRPKPPKRITVSNLQALRFNKDVDPYYKLALLSYRTKALNRDISQRLGATQRFLEALASEAGAEFVPAMGGPSMQDDAGGAAAADGGAGGEDEQQQQQPQPEQ